MKAKELIEVLQDLDPEQEVCLDREDSLAGNYVPVNAVTQREANGLKFITLDA